MANNDKTNDQNEFENLFSSADQDASARRNDPPKEDDVIDVPYSASDDLAGFNDLDDGSDEDGIFAAPESEQKRVKKSSSTGLLAAVAFLAVAGAGGYFYLSDPAALENIKHNLTGSVAGENVSLPSFQMTDDGAAAPTADTASAPASAPSSDVAAASPETPVSDAAVPSPLDEGAMPPQPEPVADGAAPSTTASAPVNAPADAAQASAEKVAPLTADDVAVPAASSSTPSSLSVVTAPEDVSTPLAASDVPPPADAAVAPVPAPAADPVVSAAPPAETVSAVPPSDAALPPVADAPSSVVPSPDAPVVSAAKVDNAKVFKVKPVEQKGTTLLNDEGIDPTKDQSVNSVPADGSATPAEDAGNMKVAEEKAQETKYFDSPPGDIMTRLPAPAMDPKRGKTESLIIVNTNAKSNPPKAPHRASSSMNQKVVIETTSLEAKIVSANRALKLARYDAARQMYDELYALNPREPRVLMGRAVLFQKVGENDRAIATYEELLAIDPNNAEAVVNLSGLVTKQMPAVALEKLLTMRARYPDNPAIAAQLGVAYANTGNLDDAYRYLSLASSMEPGNAQHYFNMAVVSERAGNMARAVSLYEKALEVDAVRGGSSGVSRDTIYDRLTRLRGN